MLITQAHFDYLFLDFLNRQTREAFKESADEHTLFEARLFACAIFNVCMAWLDGNYAESLDKVTKVLTEPMNIYD